MYQEKPSMLQPALIGGVFLGVTSSLPIIEWFNCACCIMVIGGGVLASFIFLRDYPDGIPRMSYGDGALLGLLTGLIGGFVWTVVEVPLAYFQSQLGMAMDDLAEVQELLNDPSIPPFIQELVASIMTSGSFSVGILLLGFFSHLVIAAIFASIGGVIGVALFQPKTPVALQTPGAPTMPPPPAESRRNVESEDDDYGNLA